MSKIIGQWWFNVHQYRKFDQSPSVDSCIETKFSKYALRYTKLNDLKPCRINLVPKVAYAKGTHFLR